MLRFVKRQCTGGDIGLPPEGMSEYLWTLLRLRGVEDEKQAKAFLRPGVRHLHDPFRMEGMEAAVERIRRAVQDRESVLVYGDYDVDGMTASSLLTLELRRMGLDVSIYIPSRHHEGYGLGETAVRQLAPTARLMITVDCGITSVSEVALAKSLGMDVIVTDHHELADTLPDCIVINPLMGDYPFRRLCGAGVALKLVHALGGVDAALRQIDLAALGTVADLVPLLGENRTIVKLGLEAISQSPRPGVAALMQAAGLTGKVLTAGQIAFALAPRLNAAGRMADARRGVELLMGEDTLDTHQIAAELSAENEYRQRVEAETLAQAEAMLRDFDYAENRAVVLVGQDWNPGVIGLVASRVVEKTYLPTVLLSQSGDEMVGSCRSIAGIDIHGALSTQKHLFTRFGGHKMAAGLTMPAENLQAFITGLNETLRRDVPPECYIPTVEYDLDVSLPDMGERLVMQLEQLQPTGFGNPGVMMRCEVQVVSARPVGGTGQHLKLTLRQGDTSLPGIAFRMGEMAERVRGQRRDVLFSPGINEWNGERSVQMEVRSMAAVADGESGLAPSRARAFWAGVLMGWAGEPEAVPAAEAIGPIAGSGAEADAAGAVSLAGAIHQIEDSRPPAGLLPACAAITRLPWETLLQRLAQDMAGSVQGTLAVCATEASLNDAMAALSGAAKDVFASEWPEDPRSYNALCLCPEGTLFARYPRAYVLDALPDGQIAALGLTHRCGAVLALDEADCGLLAEELGRFVPDREQMRRLYACVSGYTSRLAGEPTLELLARGISRMTGEDITRAMLGLIVLKELQLIAFDIAPFALRVPPMRKRPLEDSKVFRWLGGLAGTPG